MKQIKLLELFGGIGAIRSAYENEGYNVISDYVEWDSSTVSTYNHIYNENFSKKDVSDFKGKEGKYDVVVYGSSCKNFSRAGKSEGGKKNSGTESALIWEAVRIVGETKPQFVILENVKDIINKSHIETFNEYVKEMELLGYDTAVGTINSFGFGTPQTRNRLFAIHTLGKNKFDFNNIICPHTNENSYGIIEKINHKYIGEEMKSKFGDFVNTGSKTSKLGYFGKDYLDKRVYLLGNELPTLTASNQYKVNDGIGVRELTTLEQWRLMGFSDELHDKAKEVTSDSNLKKQAGNSIVVQVLQEIIKELHGGSNETNNN